MKTNTKNKIKYYHGPSIIILSQLFLKFYSNKFLLILGTQQPIIRCTRGENTKAYSPKKCAHLTKPSVNENLMKCNSQPCPAYWKLGKFMVYIF